MFFDNFDEIRVVNLRNRTDRRATMEKELHFVGLDGDPRVQFFDAFSFPDAGSFSSKGARGVYYSQLAILEQAAKKGHSVLILEDDVDFVAHVENYELKGDWAIFYGGYYADNPADLHASDIVGAHMMGFSANVVPLVASYLASIADNGIHPPIDAAYVWFRRAHPKVPTLFAEPPLGYQRPSRSDISALKFYDRLPVLKQCAQLARSMKRTSKSTVRRAVPR